MSEIMKMKELVAYQKQAIVSKTLVEKETGTVTLFAFDEGQALSEHTAPFPIWPAQARCWSCPRSSHTRSRRSPRSRCC
jgi:hypothetical protein